MNPLLSNLFFYALGFYLGFILGRYVFPSKIEGRR